MTKFYPEDENTSVPLDEYGGEGGDYADDDFPTDDGKGETHADEHDVLTDEGYDYSEPDDRDKEPIRWAKLKLGKTVLHVCSTGIVRKEGEPFYFVTAGINLIGSPYRYTIVETDNNVFEKVFMHEIIWRAFNGDVPKDWEVRHKPWVPQEYNREYPNDLSCVDIYPSMKASFEVW